MTEIEDKKSNSSGENQCSICLNSFNRDNPVELECGHMLHQKCLAQMLISHSAKGYEYKCPLCRTVLDNYKDVDIGELRENYGSTLSEINIDNSDNDDMSLDSETRYTRLRTFPNQTSFLVRVDNVNHQPENKNKLNFICGMLLILFVIGLILVIKYIK